MTEPELTDETITEAGEPEDLGHAAPVPPTEDDPELLNALECLLFAAKEPVPISRLAEVLAAEVTDLPRLLAALARRREGTGLDVAHLAGGYTLATRPLYAEFVQALLQPDPQRLSIQALETLAIIAYRQPITRPEVDEIRGVNSSGAIASLIEKNLVRISGRKDAPGRPFLLATTPYFLSVFGLTDLGELPDIGALRRAMEAQGLEALREPAEALPLAAGDDRAGELTEDLPEDLAGAL
jgi:segregation and condensation protein B